MPKDDIKPVAVSFAGAAKAWSVSTNTARAIVAENPWIRVIQIYGSRRAILFEDVEEYVRRCTITGVADAANPKMKCIDAANAANAARRAAKKKKSAAPPELADSASTASV